MNYETYKGLNKRLKDEYDFKFGKRTFKFNGLPMLLVVLVLMSLLTIQISLFYTISKDTTGTFTDVVKEQMSETISNSGRAIALIINIAVGYIIYEAMTYTFHCMVEYYWRKKNKIVQRGSLLSRIFA